MMIISDNIQNINVVLGKNHATDFNSAAQSERAAEHQRKSDLHQNRSIIFFMENHFIFSPEITIFAVETREITWG